MRPAWFIDPFLRFSPQTTSLNSEIAPLIPSSTSTASPWVLGSLEHRQAMVTVLVPCRDRWKIRDVSGNCTMWQFLNFKIESFSGCSVVGQFANVKIRELRSLNTFITFITIGNFYLVSIEISKDSTLRVFQLEGIAFVNCQISRRPLCKRF